jgi:hypothetical protein
MQDSAFLPIELWRSHVEPYLKWRIKVTTGDFRCDPNATPNLFWRYRWVALAMEVAGNAVASIEFYAAQNLLVEFKKMRDMSQSNQIPTNQEEPPPQLQYDITTEGVVGSFAVTFSLLSDGCLRICTSGNNVKMNVPMAMAVQCLNDICQVIEQDVPKNGCLSFRTMNSTPLSAVHLRLKLVVCKGDLQVFTDNFTFGTNVTITTVVSSWGLDHGKYRPYNSNDLPVNYTDAIWSLPIVNEERVLFLKRII